MFNVKPIKAFIAGLLSLGLAFGFATAVQAPANAANLQGCISSDYSPNNCQTALSSATALTVSNISENISTAISATADLSTQVVCTTGTKSFALYPQNNYADSARLTTVAGLSFSSATGQFSGTTQSTTFATANYEILAQCSDSTDLFKGALSITVVDTNAPASISPSTQTVSGTTGSAITASSSYVPSNFSPLPTYSVTSGTLPAGLTLNVNTGVISGTPTTTSSASVTVTASNTASTPQTATATVTFSITEPTQQAEPDRKVTICHRTHSETNPYVRIIVDYNSVNRPSGHQGHDEIFAGEHVFKAGIYKRAKDKDWGDIIPADPSGQNRWQPLNWTTLGQQIYNGTVAGCPAYDPFNYYNALREAGVPEGKIKAEIAQLETEQSEANPSRTETDEATLSYTGSSTKLRAEENDKVTICHATNATTNPYRRITVSASSITNKSGHYGHDDIYLTNHVFNSEVNYPANQKDWGDIIPADPTGQNRWQPLNWTPLGQKIYNGTVAGCGEQTTQEFYNEMREAGLPKKEVVKDLKAQKSVDDDAKELDEVEYTGTDPQTERTEPKEPTLPAGKTVINQSLSGIVWLDLNRDGLKDPDEPFMPNITLSVVQVSQINPASANLRTAGAVRPAAVVTVKTDANGFYIFPSLDAGDWKVVTGIPDDLGVTYDSEGGPEGEVTTTVPVGSSAFTWVGLVGDTSAINEKLLEEILLEYPSSLPIEELPTWLQEKVTAKLAELEAAANGETLAYTGSEDLAWLFFGVLIMLSGMLALVAKKR